MNNDHMNDSQAQDIHELYQTLEQEQPPAELDARILQAAHKAIAETENKVVDFRSPRRAWYVPVSYAAIILISLSLVMKLSLEPELQAPEPDYGLPLDDVDEPLPAAADFKAREIMELPTEVIAPSTRQVELSELKKQEVERKSQQRVMRAKSMAAPAPMQDVEQISRSKPAVSEFSAQEEVRLEELNGVIPDDEVEDWVVYMQVLLSEQQYDKLRQSLYDFRQQHPDYKLPDELVSWLEENQFKN